LRSDSLNLPYQAGQTDHISSSDKEAEGELLTRTPSCFGSEASSHTVLDERSARHAIFG